MGCPPTPLPNRGESPLCVRSLAAIDAFLVGQIATSPRRGENKHEPSAGLLNGVGGPVRA